MHYITSKKPELTLALNQPYQIEDQTDWFIPQHAEARGLAHSLIEIRNDQLIVEESITSWASLISGAISQVLHQVSYERST